MKYEPVSQRKGEGPIRLILKTPRENYNILNCWIRTQINISVSKKTTFSTVEYGFLWLYAVLQKVRC